MQHFFDVCTILWVIFTGIRKWMRLNVMHLVSARIFSMCYAILNEMKLINLLILIIKIWTMWMLERCCMNVMNVRKMSYERYECKKNESISSYLHFLFNSLIVELNIHSCNDSILFISLFVVKTLLDHSFIHSIFYLTITPFIHSFIHSLIYAYINH